jgi:translin
MLFDKKEFVGLKKVLESDYLKREKVISLSRSVLVSSKHAIYSVHRGDFSLAEENLKNAEDVISKIKSIDKDFFLYSIGAFSDALEEFVEAKCYYFFMMEKKLLSFKSLGVLPEIYLAGISDLVGELVRTAINSAIKGDYDLSVFIRDFISEVYSELMLFEFKGLLRKKFDSIKYGLEKLDELVLHFKMKGLGNNNKK